MPAYYKFSVALFFLCISGIAEAQQIPVYSQYMFNKFILNPAVAGSEGYTAYNITSRIQWLGFRDAPVTHSISAQTRLLKSKLRIRFNKNRIKYLTPESGTVGLGVYLYNDHRGLIDQTGIHFAFAYHEKIELKEQLSFGLSLSLTQFKINTGKMIPFQTDEYLHSGKFSMFIPDFNFGVYYTSQSAFLGFSVAQLMQSSVYFGNYEDHHIKLKRNYNLMGGYRFMVHHDLYLEPGFQFKTTDQFFYQIDIGCRLYYNTNAWGGIAYRTGKALVFTIGAKYNKFYFGYAYDYSLNSLQTYSYGTHELVISLKLKENERKYGWMERF